MNSNIKKILTAVGIIILIVLGIYLYSTYFVSNDTGALSSETLNTDFPGKKIRDQLTTISKLKLQTGTALFADPTYQSLSDRTVTLGNEPAGRSNPFAPLVAPVAQPISKAPAKTTSKR